MKSQNATATLGNITSCAGENVLVPLNVTDFIDVGAMTIYIGYDTNEAAFLSLQNINPVIPGSISYNEINGQINIAYSSMEPFSLTGESIFDLSFTFLGDSTLLPFKPGTEIANINLEVLPLDTYPGSIANSIQLIDQPDSVESYPDNDVIFRITTVGENNYQWQENAGNGWLNLQNSTTYSGVNNDTLFIHDVPLSFNGYSYRCVITQDECSVISDPALLEVATVFPVATLGFVNSCPGNEILEPLFVGDFMDVVEFTFNIAFDTEYLTFVDLENVHPGLLSGTLTALPLNSPPGIAIHWEGANAVSITSGTLFDLMFDYESGNHAFTFEEGTYALNSFSNPINITLNNGSIGQYDLPVITGQPQDETIMELEEATFSVESSGTDEFVWMESNDNGNSWIDLTNTPPYYNVETAVLTINPAYYYLDGHQYACRLSNENCSVVSASAVLTVDTLTFISDPEPVQFIKVSPVPFRDNIHITVPGAMSCKSVSIYNLQGSACYDYTLLYNKKEEINLDLSFLKEGVYILKVSGVFKDREIMEQRKILKTK